MAIKYSRQREAILEELRSRHDHPTAEELYFSLKQNFPNLSLGTVYRNLNMLFEDGIIMKFPTDGADHFDANTLKHYHFLCTKCGKMFDINLPVIEGIEEKAQNFADGKITSHQLIFTGVCSNCQQ